MEPEELVIRDYLEDDYINLIEFWELVGLSNKKRGDNNTTIVDTLKQKGKLLIMTYLPASKLIGTSWITNDGRRLYIHHFGIHPNFRGHGLSKLLMEATMSYAKETGLQTKLEVHRENHIAINLYEQYGFEYLGDYMVLINRVIGAK